MKAFVYNITAVLFAALFSITVQAQDQIPVNSFNGAFSYQFHEDETRNFFAVNLNDLGDDASKKAFIKKVYYDSNLAALSSPDANGVWQLTAHKIFDKASIVQKLDDIRSAILQGEQLAIDQSKAKE